MHDVTHVSPCGRGGDRQAARVAPFAGAAGPTAGRFVIQVALTLTATAALVLALASCSGGARSSPPAAGDGEKAQRHEIRTWLIDAENRLQASEAKCAELRHQFATLESDLEELEQRCGTAMRAPAGPREGPPALARQAPAEARVIALNKNDSLIVSAGINGGLVVGERMTVLRGDKYIGKILLLKVDRDWSMARPLRDLMAEGEWIREGDTAISER